MSWAFIAALKKNPQQSYIQLLNSIRAELEDKYTQKPQLSCSHPLSEFCPFFHMSAVVFVVWFRYGANTITVDTNLLYVM
jgi:hypothetical protein